MAYQEITRQSYGQRVGGSFKGIGAGILMFIGGTILLFWNEGDFVKTRKSIQEAEGVVVNIDDVSRVDPSLNGKLIHATAFADTKEVLTDGLFGVKETAISIRREVAYYQYKEKSSSKTREKIGGGTETVTTYTYEKDWAHQPVKSDNFHDPAYRNTNFVLADIEDKTVHAKEVSFGGYRLPDFIIGSISGSVPAEARLGNKELQQWEKVIAEKMMANRMNLNDPNQYALRNNSLMVHPVGNIVYFGQSPSAPAIGDVRVTLTKIMPATISIISKINGGTFEQYHAKNGKTFSSVKMGTVSAENMFSSAHSSNSMWTWILRIIGIILVIGGLKAMFGILPTLFKVIPFLGSIVGAGVGLVCNILGGAWSLLVISVSWLFYRPLVGIPLILISIAGIWYLNKKGSLHSRKSYRR